jgi:ubiquinone/menaquinone biosynthesis C-methylase UbiE
MTEIICDETRSETSTAYARWLRVMALVYDPYLWLGELMGMRRRRQALLTMARGRVVEIGAGTGLNVAHYPDTIDELILTEPEPGMRRALQRRAHDAVVLDAPAERLPMDDASVDTVVATLVLCTVPDPDAALREIARVLRPGGQVLFIEHVRSSSRLVAAYQKLMVRPWRAFAGGCVCNRTTLETLRANGFRVHADEAIWHGMPIVVHPVTVGRATRAEVVPCS